jgi:thiamine-phosphate pyrophosphorylase
VTRGVPRLYIITDRRATGGRPLTDVVRAALAGAPPGAVGVQLREKDLDGRALVELARALRPITAAAEAALYVNDRIDVALAAGADGVHLGGGALSPADVTRIAPALAVAVSAHAPAEVVEAARAPNVRFAVLGPIFDTPSKRAFGPPLGVDVLRASTTASALPVLALGGVSGENAPACVAAGASGGACIRAVMSVDDPGAAVRAFLGVFRGG